MVSADQQATAPAASAPDRFRDAQRALWAAYGLAASERFVELSEPRVRSVSRRPAQATRCCSSAARLGPARTGHR